MVVWDLSGLNLSGRNRLPVLLQSEAAECGLACLAMVAGFHGRRISLNRLRRDHPVSLKGANLKTLMQVAHQLSFTVRPLRLDLEELPQLRLPAVLHWNLNHFVVLKRVRKGCVEVHDPAVGLRRLPIRECSKHFTGVALELLPAPGFEAKDERERLKLSHFWREAVGLKRFLLQLLGLSAALQLFSLLSPFYVQLVVDEAVIRHDASLLMLLAAGFSAVLLLRVALGWLRSWMVIYLGNVLSLQMRGNLLRHLLRLPLAFFSKRHVGDVVSRFGSMSAVQNLLTTGFVQALLDGALLLTTMLVLFLYQPGMALLVVGLLLIYAVLRLSLYPPYRELSHENLVISAEASTQFMETIRGMATVKQFGLELERTSQWQNRFVEVTNTGIRISRLTLGYGAVNEVLFGLGNIAVLCWGGMLILEEAFTVGMLMAFVSYKHQFLGAGSALVDTWMRFKLLDLHLERLADIALSKPEEELGPSPASALRFQGSLKASGISFAYAPDDAPVVDRLDLGISPGECIAIVGPSGSGKSTLMRLLQGLESPSGGVVEFGGVDIRKLGLANYRQMVASVTQEDRLLSGSIAENITLFADNPDRRRMVFCAQVCRIHDAIMRMPMNYYSLIGDMGDALSAGERQRLMLARALYRQPKVLFLDEATSNLDPEVEEKILCALSRLKITRVMVTHRHAPLRYADRIFQLVDGQLTGVRQFEPQNARF